MPDHNGLFDPETLESRVEQIRLRGSAPQAGSRTLTVAVTRTIENDHPVTFCKPIDDAAGKEVLHHAAIAMEKHDGWSAPTIEKVKPNAVHDHETTERGIPLLGLLGAPVHGNGPGA
jgi:hypothetical protein